MPNLSWLHLSDLHFDSDTSFDRRVMEDALCDDLQSFLSTNTISLQFVFVTGDIANTGSTGDYKIAKQFFERICDITSVDKSNIFFVPGNHDVNRHMVSRYCDDKRNEFESRDDIRKAVEEDIDEYLKRLNNYSKFISSFYSKSYKMTNINYFYSEIKNFSTKSIGIIGLNTAWSCYGDRNDCNNIYISESQILNAIKDVKKADIRIALLHHPINWLYEVDKFDCEEILLKHCDIILHGHLHKPNFQIINSVRGDQIVIPAGSIFGDRRLSNSYNITQIDFSAKTISIYPRKYSDYNRKFFKDIDMLGADDISFCRMDLPGKIANKLS